MPDLSSYEGFRDWVLGGLVTAVVGLISLVRKLDVGEITRRLEKLEKQVEKLQERHTDRDRDRDRVIVIG